MYPVTNAVRDLFWSGARQVVRITFQGSDGTITLTEVDVMQGGLSIDRYSVSGSKIEIGSAVAAELTLKLDNKDGRFNNVVFEGAELYVQIGIRDWTTPGDTINWVPCGYFTVDEPPRTLSIINLKALDRMVRFDRVVDPTQLTFPMTVETLIQRCCALCDVTMVSGLSGFPNRSYSITAYPANSGGELTYRALIQWCAALLGTCAFIRWDGLLTFQWYTATGITITPAQRYSSDLLEKDIVLTGVTFTDSEDRVYTAGNSRDYALDLTGNGLIQSGPQAVLNALSGVLTGFTYRAYTAEIKPSPFFYPMDKITFTDSEGNTHPAIVTSVTFLMNGTTGIAGAGETGQMNGYASTGALTQQQSVIIKKLINTDITREALAAIQLNETIANSLGLYRTEIAESDGSTTYYFHDAATLADSTIIYTFRAGGFAWTDDWNGGNPVWNYGITRQGNALLNILTVYKLQADQIEAHSITTDMLETGIALQNGNTSARVGDIPTWHYYQGTGDFERGTATGLGLIRSLIGGETAVYGITGDAYEGTSAVGRFVSAQTFMEKTDTLSNDDNREYDDDFRLCHRGEYSYLLNSRLTNLQTHKIRKLTISGDSATLNGKRIFSYGLDGIMYGQTTTNPYPSTVELEYSIDDRMLFWRTRTGFVLNDYHFFARCNNHYLDLSSDGLSVDGHIVAYNSSSSIRYKHDVVNNLESNLNPHKLYDLPVKQFVYNEDHPLQYADMKGQTLPGFIAEDVERVYPAAVIRNADGEVESWDERRIVPGMLALIQEQRKEIDELKAAVKELKEQMFDLKRKEDDGK